MAFGRRSTATTRTAEPPAPAMSPPDPDHDPRSALVDRLAVLDAAASELARIASEADDRLAAARATLAEIALAHGGMRLTIGQAPSDPRALDRASRWSFGFNVPRPPAVAAVEDVVAALVEEAAPIAPATDRVTVERAAIASQLEQIEAAMRERAETLAREAAARRARRELIGGEPVDWSERFAAALGRLGLGAAS